MHVLTNRFKEMWAITIHEWACCHSSLSLFIWELRMSNNAQLMSTAPSFFVWQNFGTDPNTKEFAIVHPRILQRY